MSAGPRLAVVHEAAAALAETVREGGARLTIAIRDDAGRRVTKLVEDTYSDGPSTLRDGIASTSPEKAADAMEDLGPGVVRGLPRQRGS